MIVMDENRGWEKTRGTGEILPPFVIFLKNWKSFVYLYTWSTVSVNYFTGQNIDWLSPRNFSLTPSISPVGFRVARNFEGRARFQTSPCVKCINRQIFINFSEIWQKGENLGYPPAVFSSITIMILKEDCTAIPRFTLRLSILAQHKIVSSL